MYAKVFRSLWEGTLAGSGERWAVFVFLLAHADPEGFVDIHPKAIAALTGFDEAKVRAALLYLESEDLNSRSNEQRGARLERIDGHRDWGWRIVNYVHYRTLRDPETVRIANRERQRKHRSLSHSVTPSNASSPQEEVEVEVEEKKESTSLGGAEKPAPPEKGPVHCEMPLKNGGSFLVYEADVARWRKTYPTVDIPQTLREQTAWLESNPARKKTRKGMPRFINHWFLREEEKPYVEAPAANGYHRR
jgi:hypothetical protein